MMYKVQNAPFFNAYKSPCLKSKFIHKNGYRTKQIIFDINKYNALSYKIY